MSGEPPDLKVVQLHDGRPLLNDIPNRLRQLAELIENGVEPADYVFVILDGNSTIPHMFGYGAAMDTRSILGLLDITKDWFIRQRVAAAKEDEE